MSPKQNAASIPEGRTLATFADYKLAVTYVESMIENDFPARLVSIIGTDLKSVESIKGKLGYGRVALSGALTGSWLGMFFGLIFGASGTGAEAVLLTNVTAGVVIGAGIGMLINVIRFSLTKNRRGFVSGQMVVAKKYEVVVPKEQLQLAKKAVAAAKPAKTAKKSS
jgi:hypothetical protein